MQRPYSCTERINVTLSLTSSFFNGFLSGCDCSVNVVDLFIDISLCKVVFQFCNVFVCYFLIQVGAWQPRIYNNVCFGYSFIANIKTTMKFIRIVNLACFRLLPDTECLSEREAPPPNISPQMNGDNQKSHTHD